MKRTLNGTLSLSASAGSGTRPPATANAFTKTLSLSTGYVHSQRLAEEVIRFIEQKRPCLAA
jgi:hypothetical protein